MAAEPTFLNGLLLFFVAKEFIELQGATHADGFVAGELIAYCRTLSNIDMIRKLLAQATLIREVLQKICRFPTFDVLAILDRFEVLQLLREKYKVLNFTAEL